MKAAGAEVRQFYRRMGRAVRMAREDRGISQGALAYRLGCTQGAVQFWEEGMRKLPADRIPEVCRILRVTPQELLGMAQS